MSEILVAGARGFVGRNLCAVLRRMESVQLMEIDQDSTREDLEYFLSRAEVFFHLAGVNRPQQEMQFFTGNTALTEDYCTILKRVGRAPKIVFSSSIQAGQDNPYGMSKRLAEETLRTFANKMGAECIVYRLKNLFGKWCRPNYNSVTATFCHNIAHGLPVHISNPARELELTYIDEVISVFVAELQPGRPGFRFAPPLPCTRITLGELAEKIQAFRNSRSSLRFPDLRDHFDRALYATYLSYLDREQFSYSLEVQSDQRGSLAEFLKSSSLGQLFVSSTNPGVTRGNHYHHTKAEKFLVLHGTAIIRLRQIESEEILEYRLCGEDFHVVDIPPGYTHTIENIGEDDLVTLFWASEVFDPDYPDTYWEPVQKVN